VSRNLYIYIPLPPPTPRSFFEFFGIRDETSGDTTTANMEKLLRPLQRTYKPGDYFHNCLSNRLFHSISIQIKEILVYLSE
jgi:hypothetical protein